MTSPIRVGLMGFGRIGRNVFRQLEETPGIEVAAIADTADPAGLVYLLEFDTIFGRFPGDVELDGSDLVVNGRRVPILDGAEPGDVDWGSHDVEIVVQATRKHRTLTECRRHRGRRWLGCRRRRPSPGVDQRSKTNAVSC